MAENAFPSLVALSEKLHANPETAWQEHQAVGWVGGRLGDGGFDVTAPYLGLDTAFHARISDGPVRVGLCAEYDALPGLGHACGHNLIAAISVGAALALADVADEAGLTVEVFGTPAEEGGGGKIEMLDRGAFAGLDLAMMAHPAPVDVAEARPFAVSHSEIVFTGKSAHAAAYPEHGRNAADAFTIAQVALGLLRQQLPASVRVHGIVTDGGEAPNAIPERTRGRWYVRAESLDELEAVEQKVFRCFEAGALASGCEVSITPESKPYAEFRTDERALQAYRSNAAALGRNFAAGEQAGRMNRASTDMGNVSQAVPAIHPYIGIDSLPALNHQREFADHCVGERAERASVTAPSRWRGPRSTCSRRNPLRLMSADARVEHDLLGARTIPAGVYWGIHTARAVENFPISGVTLAQHRPLIAALGAVKQAAARANRELGMLDLERADAIDRACVDVMRGRLGRPVRRGCHAGRSGHLDEHERQRGDHQQGAGARSAARWATTHTCTPNDHVNRGQSTNDVYPTAVKLALIRALDG